MFGKLVKIIDWMINVPDEDKIEDRAIYSTNFSIDHNGVITKWHLSHDFNGKYIESYILN